MDVQNLPTPKPIHHPTKNQQKVVTHRKKNPQTSRPSQWPKTKNNLLKNLKAC